MEAEVNFTLKTEQGNVKSEGQAKANLDEKYLTLSVEFGEPMLVATLTSLRSLSKNTKLVSSSLPKKNLSFQA